MVQELQRLRGRAGRLPEPACLDSSCRHLTGPEVHLDLSFLPVEESLYPGHRAASMVKE